MVSQSLRDHMGTWNLIHLILPCLGCFSLLVAIGSIQFVCLCQPLKIWDIFSPQVLMRWPHRDSDQSDFRTFTCELAAAAIFQSQEGWTRSPRLLQRLAI